MELVNVPYASLSRLDAIDGSMVSQLFSVQTLESKIIKAEKQIQEEKEKQDENVKLYLKMAAVSRDSEISQFKILFEKRNIKSTNKINGLRRKLMKYEEDLKDAKTREAMKSSSPSPQKRLFGTPKSGDRRFLHKLHKGDGNKSNSSPDVSYQPPPSGPEQLNNGQKEGEGQAVNRGRNDSNSSAPSDDLGGDMSGSDDLEGKSEHSSDTESIENPIYSANINHLMQELYQIQEEASSLRGELTILKLDAETKSTTIKQDLQAESFRSQRLEEQLNDLTELHQAETTNLKQALSEVEGKLMYQNDDNLRDLTDMFEACQERIKRLEQQQQQLITVEGMQNSTARVLLIQLVNGCLAILNLLCLTFPITASLLSRAMNNRLRLVTSILIGLSGFYIQRTWPQTLVWVLTTWRNVLDRFDYS